MGGAGDRNLFGEIAIVERMRDSRSSQAPQDMTFAMRHDDRDPFTYAAEGESAIGTVGITFTPGAEARRPRSSSRTAKGPSRAPTDR